MFSHYKFQERKQKQGETFETFVTDLRNLAKDCNYDKPSEMVRDRIVAGILSQDIYEKLLTEGNTLTMDKAIGIAVTYETTQQYLKSMATSATPTNVDAIKQKRQQTPRQQKRQEDKRIQYRHHEVIDCQNCGGTIQANKKVASCPICTPTRNPNPRELMKPHVIPDRPWQKVGTDLFTVDNKQYLVTVDSYSRYFEVDELTSTTSNAIIRKLSTHFARHGISEVATSDNVPQFAAEEFARFAQTWHFKHVTSSPGYPQSNGLAEKQYKLSNTFSKVQKQKVAMLY